MINRCIVILLSTRPPKRKINIALLYLTTLDNKTENTFIDPLAFKFKWHKSELGKSGAKEA